MEQGSEKGGGKAALLLMIFTAVSFERIADTSGNYDQTLQKKKLSSWWFGTFFPFSWERHNPNCYSLHHFSEA